MRQNYIKTFLFICNIVSGIYCFANTDTIFVTCQKTEVSHIAYKCKVDFSKLKAIDFKLMVASVGYHELFVNGKKVDERILAPAQSRLDKRVLSIIYDISHLLKKSENEIEVDYAPGWARFHKYINNLEQGFYTNLEAEWQYHPLCSYDTGRKTYKDMGGELFDANMPNNALCLKKADCRKNAIRQIISEQRCPPTKILKVWEIDKTAWNGSSFVFPKNYTGWVNIKLKGMHQGDTIKYLLADDPNGKDDFLQWNYYICNGRNEEIQNRFNYMAGRYLFIEGLSKDAKIISIKGMAIGTDLQLNNNLQAINFKSTDSLLKKIYETDLWTYRMCTTEGYTSDCPHRERLGYGEEATACSWAIGMENYDAREMYKQNIINWIDTQDENGYFTHTAPQMWGAGGTMWSSAPLNIAWEGYQRYKDKEFLTLIYEPGRKWLEYLNSYAKDSILTPYTNNKRHFLGDWGTAEGKKEYGDTEAARFFNNCVYVWNLHEFIEISKVLNKDASIYEHRLDKLIPELTKHFYHADKGYYSNGLQVPQAFALWMDIVPDSIKAKIEAHFLYQLTTAQPYLGMGSSGIIPLLHYLCEHPEYDDIVIAHLNKITKPSYGYFLSQGETCWPEYWTNDVPSKIHTCYTGISKLISTIIKRRQ